MGRFHAPRSCLENRHRITAVLLGRPLLEDDEGLDSPASRRRVVVAFALAGTLGMIKTEGVFVGSILVMTWMSCSFRRHGVTRLQTLIWPRPLALYIVLVLMWPVMPAANGIDLRDIQGAFGAMPLPEFLDRFQRLPAIAVAFSRIGPSKLLPMGAALIITGAAVALAPRTRLFLTWTGASSSCIHCGS